MGTIPGQRTALTSFARFELAAQSPPLPCRCLGSVALPPPRCLAPLFGFLAVGDELIEGLMSGSPFPLLRFGLLDRCRAAALTAAPQHLIRLLSQSERGPRLGLWLIFVALTT